MKPERFRKLPVEVEALQWTGGNWSDMMEFILGNGGMCHTDGVELYIDTLEGEYEAGETDWIIRGVAGEFYPCKPAIFEQTYERV